MRRGVYQDDKFEFNCSRHTIRSRRPEREEISGRERLNAAVISKRKGTINLRRSCEITARCGRGKGESVGKREREKEAEGEISEGKRSESARRRRGVETESGQSTGRMVEYRGRGSGVIRHEGRLRPCDNPARDHDDPLPPSSRRSPFSTVGAVPIDKFNNP